MIGKRGAALRQTEFSSCRRKPASRYALYHYPVEILAADTPEPGKVEAVTDGVVFQFVQGPAAVTFHLKPKKFGLVSGKARLVQAAPITFTQFIYP